MSLAQAAENTLTDYTGHWVGYACMAIFAFAYFLVIIEEAIHLRKCKPVMTAAGIIWVLVSYVYQRDGRADEAADILRHNFLEYAELAFFLMSAIIYINTLDERNIFQALRVKLISSGFSFRTLYWITGLMAFCMSPVADNLTTALVLGSVMMAVGAGNRVFVSISCINIVVAANAGGAFSPFGDITTLMVWQKGIVTFFEFFKLFIPALVSWLVPAFLMSFAVKNTTSPQLPEGAASIRRGGYVITALFLLTVVMTIMMHHILHMPPFLGMMTGLGFLMSYSYFIRNGELKLLDNHPDAAFDIFTSIKRVEWDTLIFFYGIILCVGGIGALGYLACLSHFMYVGMGATAANIMVGILSSVIDNIPVMFAVISMNPDMSHGQWLLVTLTTGIGGSLLSVGSAAGVALMGQARGIYTFFVHLKWAWTVALGYIAGILAHIFINGIH